MGRYGEHHYFLVFLLTTSSNFSGPRSRYRSQDGYNWDPSYTSHSHGWSSGATSALTFYVLGLTVTTPQGQTWSVAPHSGGLQKAEGGFETGLGWFGIKWQLKDGEMTIYVNTPEGTSGVVIFPNDHAAHVDMDGRHVDAAQLMCVSGGEHTFVGRSG